MNNNQDQENSDMEKTGELTDKIRDALKESVMDFTGHFSTASAILAGFYMATCAFIISVRANESIVFSFLDEPLLAEITFLADLVINILTFLDLQNLYPSHFEYMLLIFVSLFLLSLISYACFLRAGMIQMRMLRTKNSIPEEKVLTWQHRGSKTLLISLLFSFITLPWAMLRFVYVNSMAAAILIVILVITLIVFAFAGWEVLKKLYSKVQESIKQRI